MYIHVCIKVEEIKKGQITSGSSASQFKRKWIPRTKNKSTLAKPDTYLDIINVILQFLCYTCLSWKWIYLYLEETTVHMCNNSQRC